jgi:hypothetical protein
VNSRFWRKYSSTFAHYSKRKPSDGFSGLGILADWV